MNDEANAEKTNPPYDIWEVADSPFMFEPSPVRSLEEIRLERRRRRRERALQRLLAEDAQLRWEIAERRRRSGQ